MRREIARGATGVVLNPSNQEVLEPINRENHATIRNIVLMIENWKLLAMLKEEELYSDDEVGKYVGHVEQVVYSEEGVMFLGRTGGRGRELCSTSSWEPGGRGREAMHVQQLCQKHHRCTVPPPLT